jgi:hypothetical protein
MRVRLTRKLAASIDGVDLTRRRVGDVFDLPLHDAQLLVAHGWAQPQPERQQRSEADDSSSRRKPQPTDDQPLTIHIPVPQDEDPA